MIGSGVVMVLISIFCAVNRSWGWFWLTFIIGAIVFGIEIFQAISNSSKNKKAYKLQEQIFDNKKQMGELSNSLNSSIESSYKAIKKTFKPSKSENTSDSNDINIIIG